jgi:hypothetical protein
MSYPKHFRMKLRDQYIVGLKTEHGAVNGFYYGPKSEAMIVNLEKLRRLKDHMPEMAEVQVRPLG